MAESTEGATVSPASVELSRGDVAWFEVLVDARRKIAEGKATEALAIEHLKAALGDAHAATIDGQPAIAYAPGETSRFQVDQFRKDHPELAAQYTKTGIPTRSFRPVMPDDDEGAEEWAA